MALGRELTGITELEAHEEMSNIDYIGVGGKYGLNN